MCPLYTLPSPSVAALAWEGPHVLAQGPLLVPFDGHSGMPPDFLFLLLGYAK